MRKNILKYTIVSIIIFSMILAVFAGLITAAMSA
jgi:uncharacterized protein YpmB